MTDKAHGWTTDDIVGFFMNDVEKVIHEGWIIFIPTGENAKLYKNSAVFLNDDGKITWLTLVTTSEAHDSLKDFLDDVTLKFRFKLHEQRREI